MKFFFLAIGVLTASGGTFFIHAQDVTVTKIADRVESVTFESKTLSATKKFSVVLPANYDAAKSDWPMFCFLHGRGRNDRTLIENEATRKLLLDSPFVTVLPNGEDSFYIDSPAQAKNKYATFLEEVIDLAEKKYNLSHDRKKRGMGGWSMGGYGTMRYAEAHPDQFSYVTTVLGLLDFPRNGLPDSQTYKIPTEKFGKDESVWTKFNPISDAEKLKDMKIVIVTGDEAFDRTMNENFHNRLTELKIEHDWSVVKGEHKLDGVVIPSLPKMLGGFKEVLNTKNNNRK